MAALASKSPSAIKFRFLPVFHPSQPTNLSNSCHMTTATFTHDHFQSCFQNWLKQEYKDLDELLNVTPTTNDEKLMLLSNKAIKHLEEYYERRALMSQHGAPSFLSPPWCSSFENAFLWIGGCRPSLYIRLIYSVCGAELEDQLSTTDIPSRERNTNLAEISAEQLDLINALHCKTIREEEELSAWMASLQEDIDDEPLALSAQRACEIGLNQNHEEVDRAMNGHSMSLARILTDADRLRLRTLKLLMDILTPSQAVDLLIATKKLRLWMHEWGKQRDQLLGHPANLIHHPNRSSVE